MFNLFRKEVKPKVYAFYIESSRGWTGIEIQHGFDRDEAEEKAFKSFYNNSKKLDGTLATKEEVGNLDVKYSCFLELEPILNEYTKEMQDLKKLEQ